MQPSWLSLPNIPQRAMKAKAHAKPHAKPIAASKKPRAAAQAVPKPRSAKPRPIVTPSIMPATLFHPPMPRLKPQPIKTSMMIKNRIRTRQKRLDESRLLAEWLEDHITEVKFEQRLAELDPGFRVEPELLAGHLPFRERLKVIAESRAREQAREKTPISPELLALVAKAKKRKIIKLTERNKRKKLEAKKA